MYNNNIAIHRKGRATKDETHPFNIWTWTYTDRQGTYYWRCLSHYHKL